MHKRLLMIALLAISALSVAGLGGCAQDVGDIDRTQPNKLRKSVFEGEWYVRQTVVGVPGTAMTSFVGFEGDTNRIRFRFQENLLVAHRAHEDVLGIDTSNPPVFDDSVDSQLDVSATDGEIYGAPIAAFGVQSHFDIQRDYNPTTGEQSNTIGENSFDRYWDDREYARIDWGRNLVQTSTDSMKMYQDWNSVSWWEAGSDVSSPLYVECRDDAGKWYDCDPDDLNAQKEIAYLEVTSTYVMTPSWIDCIFTFGFPMYGGDCGPEQIQVRTSFVKIEDGDPDKYEPRQYADTEMDWFGYFRTERCSYDRLYGCTDEGRIFLAQRHRIWEDWRDEEGNRLDYAARDTKPIVYYLNDDYPIDLLDESVVIARQYDDAFKDIVRNAKDPAFEGTMFYLCANSMEQVATWQIAVAKANGRDKDSVAAEYGDQVQDFDTVWAETPAWNEHWLEGVTTVNGVTPMLSRDNVIAELTKGYGDGVCDRPEKPKRIGDLRYSYIAWVDNPQQEGPLGYGPSSNDPLSGETITGDAYMYGASVDTYAQYTVDLIDLINGELDSVEYGYGEHISGYLRDIEERFGIPSRPEDLVNAERERMDKMQHKLDQIDWRHNNPEFFDKISNADPSMLRREVDNYRSTWNQLRGTKVEEMLITEEVKVGLGAGLFGPNDTVDSNMVEALDPATMLIPPAPGGSTRHLSVSSTRDYWKNFERFSENNMFMASFLDDQLLGLAEDFKERYGDIEDDTERRLRIFYDIRGLVYRHVTEHEVGHTVGLRHNFEGSYDAMNYHPEYWKIRFDSDAQLGYEHHKPDRGVTTLDLKSRIREYQYSTTMDYGGRPNSQVHGIGLYDKAALAYAYADLVHVFEQGSEPKKLEANFRQINNPGSIYQVFDEDTPLTRSSETITNWDDVENATFTENGAQISDDGLDHDLDFWNYTVLPVMFTDSYDNPSAGNMDAMYRREFITLSEYQAGNRLRVPYRFCSDEYRGALPFCNVFDEGADYTEIIHTAIEGYDAYYFHNSYRRGRAAWGLWLWPHIMRLYGRYFLPIGNMYQQWYIRISEWGPAFSTNPWGGLAHEVGVEDGLRALLGVLAAPHPGTYRYDDQTERFLHLSNELDYRCTEGDETCEDFVGVGSDDQYLTLEPGLMVKWRYSRFDYDSGYYYFLRYEILSSFWDRLGALWALTNPESNFLGVDAASNITGFMIPYYLLYDYELSRFFGGIMTEDVTTFAPVIPTVGGIEGGVGGSEFDKFALQDPLATWQELNDYGDPSKFQLINPYPENYGHSSFTDRLYTMAYALSFFQVLYDQSFNHASQIFIVGSGQGWTIADSDNDGVSDIEEGNEDRDMNGIPAYLDANEVTAPEDREVMPHIETYTDPFNSKTYVAVDYKDFDFYGRRHFVPAVELLQRANRLKDRYLDTNDFSDKYEVQQIREEIELMMVTNQIFAQINAPWWIPYLAP